MTHVEQAASGKAVPGIRPEIEREDMRGTPTPSGQR
jgi:hypothetical protein